MSIIGQLKTNIAYLNQRQLNYLSTESILIDDSDLEEYDRLLDSDDEDEDDGEQHEEDNGDGVDDIEQDNQNIEQFIETDASFSVDYAYYTDERGNRHYKHDNILM